MAQIIDGKAIAARLRAEVARQVAALRGQHGLTPRLDVVLVGEDPASQVYVRNKARYATEVGIVSRTHALGRETPSEELLQIVRGLNDDPQINGILVQLPLPKHIDQQRVICTIEPAKDVDGFHPYNRGLLAMDGAGMVPCTPRGCLILLKDCLGDLTGRRALVLGRSNIVGKPLAALLLGEHCTVTVAHSRTRDLPAECRRAEILVVAIGQAQMVKGDWIGSGACVIDVGINRMVTADGKSRLVGDVDFSAACRVAAAITPVPGGVGPMTIACLLLNTVEACRRQYGIQDARDPIAGGPPHVLR